jgi:DNA-binding beta-propeller fold protein YncE
MTGGIRRREFLHMAAGAAAAVAAPSILTARKTDSPLIIGSGEYRYEVQHNWPQLPEKFTWQTTHNVAVDRAGNLYVIHEGDPKKKDHPSIFVFDKQAEFVRSFGKEFQGGGHGLEVHEEGGEEFLYVTAYQALKKFAKLTLHGEPVWERHAPMDSGMYAPGEDTIFDGTWGRDRFMPTNIAFHPDGDDFYVADGYGAYAIHRYDKDANYKSTFGREGNADGQFNLPHGVWVDRRKQDQLRVVVADRVNARLQWFTLDGMHLETLGGFILPANVDTLGELLLVPDLQARVTLLDGNNNVVAKLGDDAAWRTKVMEMKERENPENCPPGKFIHPHDACFDAQGNIFIAEWVATGRVTKLRKVS